MPRQDVKYYDGSEHVYYSDQGVDPIHIYTTGKHISITGLQINTTVIYIDTITDFPTAISGIITLLDDSAYIITGILDLSGSRIVCRTNSCIYGISSEITFLTSTGLGVGVPLISSNYTVNLRDITIHDVGTALLLQANAINTYVCDWTAVNFIDVASVGLIKDYNNFIFNMGTFIRSANMIFSGTINTIGFGSCLFSGLAGQSSIILDNSLILGRRFKLFESSAVIPLTGIGIFVGSSAVIPTQGIILTSVNFSGGSTNFIDGVTAEDDEALWFKCIGISNSQSVGQIHYSSTVSTTMTVNVWKKLTSITDASSINSKFTTLVNNRLTYTGKLTQVFMVNYSCSYTGTNGNVITTGVSKNGVNPVDDTWSTSTMSASGRVETSGSSFFAKLATGDYLEMWARNTSASNEVSATQITMTIFGQL